MPGTIVVDAGHGGEDTGASGHFNNEEHFTLLLSHLLFSSFTHENIKCHLTRVKDNYPTLRGRTDFANNVRADAFLSVHFNASSSPLPSGTQMLYWKTSRRGKQLAQALQNAIAPLDKQVGERHERIVAMPDANFRRDSRGNAFAPWVLKATVMPAVIMEIEFGTNPQDAQTMRDPEYLISVAQATVLSVKEWLNA